MTTGDFKPILGYPSTFWQQRSAFDLTHPEMLRASRESGSVAGEPWEEITDKPAPGMPMGIGSTSRSRP